ncbi:MAG TPA: hypothetical protein VK622_10370 [Puia sp.]|nr:hypothetical protein [Puia sp.]
MKNTLCVAISLALFSACTKSTGGGPVAPDSGETVYVSGSNWDNATNAFVPLYWEDTTVHYLPGGTPMSTYARAIAYSGNQLYIAGQATAWVPTGGLWINGVQKDISTKDTVGIGDVLGMYVSGADVYLAGNGVNAWSDYGYNTYAKIWKNGVTTTLNTNPGFSQANGITMVGADVYVAWTGTKNNGHNMALYNKNGTIVVLDSSDYDASCHSICSSGSDMYISGNVFDVASNRYEGVYWKNGSLIKLQVSNEDTYASGITTSGNDVYVAGNIYLSNKVYAAYWKNGVEHRVTDGAVPAAAYAIAVSGSDVYVAGVENLLVPTYWKNDVPHVLSNDTARTPYTTTGIVVVKK